MRHHTVVDNSKKAKNESKPRIDRALYAYNFIVWIYISPI